MGHDRLVARSPLKSAYLDHPLKAIRIPVAKERVQRRLAAILAADVVGYSRLMEQDEAGTLAVLKDRRKSVLEPLVAEHQGRIVKVMGDGVLVEFASAVNAVSCAIDLQKGMVAAGNAIPEERQVALRIGINLGDVIVEGDDLYGDGVNLAARLQELAEPGGICVSAKVREEVGRKIDIGFADFGEQQLKNITAPVRVYRLRPPLSSPAVTSQPLPLPDKPSIAVLPFTNMSSDPEQEFFADGISEDLITALSKVPGLFVIARHSTFAYKGKSIDVRQVGRELGVGHVIEGSVRRAAKRVRVTVQLVDAASGAHVWADRFDRELEDIFAVQDEVVGKIVNALSVALPASHLPFKRRAPKIEAYDLFVRGRVLTVQTIEATKLARPLLERAIELDPEFAEAHAWLAMNLTFQWIDGQQIDERERIIAAAQAERAVSLDPSNADGHFALGYAFIYKGNLSAGREQFELALKTNPNHADAWLYLADLEVFDGHPVDAVRAVERAFQLDPFPNPTFYWLMGFALYAARRYEEAVRTLEHESCRGTGSQRIRAAALAQLTRLDEARDVARVFMDAYPNFTVSTWAKTQPFRNPRDLQHFIDGYIKAGFPE